MAALAGLLGVLAVALPLAALARRAPAGWRLAAELEALWGRSPLGGGGSGSTAVRSNRWRPLVRLLGRRLAGGWRDPRLARRLAWAGSPFGWSLEEYLGVRAALAALGGLVGLLLAAGRPGSAALLLVPTWAGLAYLAPDVWLGRRVHARQAACVREAELAADLLSAAIRAGMPLRPALAAVLGELGGPLAAELRQADQGSAAGGGWAEALRGVAQRCGVAEVELLTATLAQEHSLGVPVGEALAAQARQIRTLRVNRARERARRLSVLLVPVVLVCFFVPLVVIVLWPALATLLSLF